MNVLRRVAGVFAAEGFAGVVRQGDRKVRRLLGRSSPFPDAPPGWDQRLAEARTEYEQLVGAFRDRVRALGLEGLEHYYWYHTIDLGNGLVTPGDYDYRRQLSAFGFPERMEGLRVLDVGSATGFFAFEFERRGADVVSVELPSLDDWDILSAEREEVTRQMMALFQASTPEEAHLRHLEGPFQFCRSALGSRVRRCYSSVYDLTLARLGEPRFDLVYVGDVLPHLFSPLKALDVLSGLCRGSLVVTVDVPFPGEAGAPLASFVGLQTDTTERRSWWHLSPTCIEHMLRRLGFRSVSVAGHYSGILRRAWLPYTREVISACR